MTKTNLLFSKPDWWLVILIVGLVVVVYAPVLNAGFVLIDDHGILRVTATHPLHPQVPATPPLGWDAVREDATFGRLRLTYQVYWMTLVSALGANPTAWHVLVLMLGALTGCLLYSALRVLTVCPLIALLFALLVLFSANASLTWMMLGPAENIGTLLTAVALLALAQTVVRRHSIFWNSLFIVALLGAGLAKESFVLIIPALVYARIALYSFWDRRTAAETIYADRLMLTVLGLGWLMLTAGVLWIAVGAGAQSYGGQSLSPRADFLTRLAGLLFGAWWQAGFFLPVVLVLISLWRSEKRPGASRIVLVASVFCGVWILPQLALYATRDSMVGFYWLPAMIGLAASNALALVWLASANASWYRFGVAWMMLCLMVFGGVTFARASKFHADATALDQMLNYLAQNVGMGKTVVIAAQPAENYEYTLSLISHIGYHGRKDIPLALLAIQSNSANLRLGESLASNLETYFAGHNALTDVRSEQIDAVILLVPLETLPVEWVKSLGAPTRVMEFAEPAWMPVVDKTGVRLPSQVKYQILWVSKN